MFVAWLVLAVKFRTGGINVRNSSEKPPWNTGRIVIGLGRLVCEKVIADRKIITRRLQNADMLLASIEQYSFFSLIFARPGRKDRGYQEEWDTY